MSSAQVTTLSAEVTSSSRSGKVICPSYLRAFAFFFPLFAMRKTVKDAESGAKSAKAYFTSARAWSHRQSRFTGLNCERMRKFASFRTIRVAFACAVSLWMAGAGCLMGCESMAMGSTRAAKVAEGNASSPIVSGESCASHQRHIAKAEAAQTLAPAPILENHANHASRGTRQHIVTSAFNAGPASIMECPLAVNATAALSKARTDNAKIVPVLTNVNRPLQALEQKSALVRHPRLPNRGHTYLQGCVFLI